MDRGSLRDADAVLGDSRPWRAPAVARPPRLLRGPPAGTPCRVPVRSTGRAPGGTSPLHVSRPRGAVPPYRLGDGVDVGDGVSPPDRAPDVVERPLRRRVLL